MTKDKFAACLTLSLVISTVLFGAVCWPLIPFKSWGVIVALAALSAHLAGNAVSIIFLFEEQDGWLKNTLRLVAWEAYLLRI